ncbi:MAG TPA: response regulator [Thermoanaerobaculia bacterium]
MRTREAHPSCRVLVADDNPSIADTLAQLLESIGNEVWIAYDGQQAVEAADRLHPDVILLDLDMPRLNGYEVCRHIRQQPWGAKALIIAQTGWDRDIDKRRAQAVAFDHYLVKPVAPDLLIQLVSSLAAAS